MSYTFYHSTWRLITWYIGLMLMIAGAYLQPAPDWDVGVSIVMCTFAYFTAPWVVGVFWHREWSMFIPATVVAWLGVDGLYAAYWVAKNPAALDAMRSANWPVSLCLYLICGLLWVRKP